tara:strand:+ start:160 stop:534 length:375 start_codon:yes stop_codon:yes gene_type:complete
MDDEEDVENTINLNTEKQLLPENVQKRIAIESMQLADDRLYIVLDCVETSHVAVRMYDTTDNEEVTGAHVLLHGIIHMLDNHYEEIVDYGHMTILENLSELEEGVGSIQAIDDNVVRIKFSKDN